MKKSKYALLLTGALVSCGGGNGRNNNPIVPEMDIPNLDSLNDWPNSNNETPKPKDTQPKSPSDSTAVPLPDESEDISFEFEGVEIRAELIISGISHKPKGKIKFELPSVVPLELTIAKPVFYDDIYSDVNGIVCPTDPKAKMTAFPDLELYVMGSIFGSLRFATANTSLGQALRQEAQKSKLAAKHQLTSFYVDAPALSPVIEKYEDTISHKLKIEQMDVESDISSLLNLGTRANMSVNLFCDLADGKSVRVGSLGGKKVPVKLKVIMALPPQ